MRKSRKLKGGVQQQCKSDIVVFWMNISCSKQIIGIGSKRNIYREFRNLRRMATADGALLQSAEKIIVHYEHTDECRAYRWTARECYQYLYDRPWNEVLNFYSHLTAGRLSLLNLFSEGVKEEHSSMHFKNTPASPSFGELFLNNTEKAKGGKWARRTFKILLSYDGSEFEGWQKQPGLHTVQGLVEQALGKFVDEKKARELKAKAANVEATVAVAGRTDKGVSAVQQVCSFYTWRKDINSEDVEREINTAAPEKLRVVSVYEVPRIFHPNFSARWRRYLYILPLKCGEGYETFEPDGRMCTEAINIESMSIGDREYQSGVKPHTFSVAVVNRLLQQLEGRSLSYKIFSRDTQASRSRGPATECFMYRARAAAAKLPCLEQDHARKERNVMCVELVANRFLRKMVRVLVATAIREAAAGAADDTLLKLMDATCRRASAPPAPPGGLCLVDIGYEDINQEIFLIE